jgi:hypothetical protein
VMGLAEGGQPQVQALDAEDLRNFNRLMAHSDDNPASTLAGYRQVLHRLLLALAH